MKKELPKRTKRRKSNLTGRYLIVNAVYHLWSSKMIYPILGNEKQSLCIRFCMGSYATEHRKCLCKQSNCSWTTKGKSCPYVSADDGNVLFETSNLASLRSIMREINIQNNGTINFTFQL